MNLHKLVCLVIVTALVAILLASALNNFTRVSDSALGDIAQTERLAAVTSVGMPVDLPETCAKSPPPIGPVFPPPAGGVFTSTPGGPAIGHGAGNNLGFTSLNVHRYTNLWWGPANDSSIQHAQDGNIDEVGETLTFSPTISQLPGGMARWMGSTNNGSLTTRFTLLTTSIGGSLLPMILPCDVGILGARPVVTVTSDFNANLLFEVNTSGTNFQPALDYFDAVANKTPAQGGTALSEFTGGFFYTAPDIGVQIIPSRENPQPGQTINISVAATNHGVGDASQVMVTDTLPSGLSFQSFIASQGTFDPGSGLWNAGTILDGTSQTLTLTVLVTGSGPQTVSAVKGQYQIDPNPDNDQATAVIQSFFWLFSPMILK